MSDFLEQFEYIKNQLTFIKSKVELDNQLGLLDINKLGENIFMHILNDVYDWNLINANLLQENFPAIDLVDNTNKLVVQVTSTTTTDKLLGTIEKFKALSQYSGYQLKIFYIKNKPNFQKESLSKFSQNGVLANDMLGIEDILEVIQADHNKCKSLYLTLQQRLDSIAFSFNINSYFKSVEPQLVDVTTNKFKIYVSSFLDFLSSTDKLFEIFAAGGNGKSHLIKYLSSLETQYVPLVFTKQVNIEEDLKKLSTDKKNYLLIFDDIDRFLDTNILISLLSFVLPKENCKLLITYRSASKSAVNSILRKYYTIPKQEIEIIWSKEDIYELIKSSNNSLEDTKIEKLSHTFNNNPYLITQALKGDISTIKEFSKKIIDDTETGLKDFGLTNNQISDLLFEIALIAPISENDIKKYFPDHFEIIEKLEAIKVLRKLSSKYRFNPDIQGDLFLGYYIENNQKSFEKKVEDILPFFSQTVFTNLSYALAYTQNDSLTDFIKRIIINWGEQNIYRNDYLFLVNKIVSYSPMESFVYLQNATKYLKPIENEHMDHGALSQVITKISPQNGDFNANIEAINLGSIEPIVSKLIDLLKNNTVEDLKINHIISYLSSNMVLSLPKPYYDNQTLTSIFKKIVSPLNTRNFEVILEALDTMQNWLSETPLNPKKLNLLKESIQSLVSATLDNSYSDGFTYHFGQIPLNLKHPYVLKIIDKAKDILSMMIESENSQILYAGIDSIASIGGREIDRIALEGQKFYSDLKVIFLERLVELLQNHQEFFIVSKIDKLAINILNFYSENDEALAILKAINRSDEFLLYQIVAGVDFLIVDFESFYEEYCKQDDVKKWMFDNVY